MSKEDEVDGGVTPDRARRFREDFEFEIDDNAPTTGSEEDDAATKAGARLTGADVADTIATAIDAHVPRRRR